MICALSPVSAQLATARELRAARPALPSRHPTPLRAETSNEARFFAVNIKTPADCRQHL